MNGWKYYNHAFLPTGNPHEAPDLSPIENKSIWKNNAGSGRPILARWISDFDCYDGDWYCCIKDDKFDINMLKSKRRNVVKNGIKYFDVSIINPQEYISDILAVQKEAFSAYPEKYRPTVTAEKVQKEFDEFNADIVVYGAFYKESNKLCGYTIIRVQDDVVHLQAQKTMPEYERYQVNAALLYYLIQDYNDRLCKNFYITNGERNILHETGFNEYLEKYFGFRKASCKLNIAYNPKYKALIKFLYIFKRLLAKMDNVGIIHKINGVLTMEAVVRKQKKCERKKGVA